MEPLSSSEIDSPTENASKKDLISRKFLEYFFKHGMVKTIVNDVARDLHMSKKTIYKYFSGGKEECLYYIFHQIAKNALHDYLIKHPPSDTIQIQLQELLHFIYQTAVPYVLGNVADKEEDYLIENLIVGRAFKDALQDQMIKLLEAGRQNNIFHFSDVNVAYSILYAMVSQSMELIHRAQENTIESQILVMIMKMLS
jgi:AcrR family transcriptional regulator